MFKLFSIIPSVLYRKIYGLFVNEDAIKTKSFGSTTDPVTTQGNLVLFEGNKRHFSTRIEFRQSCNSTWE